MAARVKSSISLKSAIQTASKRACASSASWAAAFALVASDGFAGDFSISATKAPPPSPAYDWSGFYVGGHTGLAGGHSDWRASSLDGVAPAISDRLGLYRSPNAFTEGGSFLMGVQGGYNYMLPNRVVLGIEADASFPAFADLDGLSIGGIANFTSPTLGAATYSETVLSSGTVRGRIGFAPGHWLFYATFGFAWTYNQQILTQAATGNAEDRMFARLGWATGAGVEVPIAKLLEGSTIAERP